MTMDLPSVEKCALESCIKYRRITESRSAAPWPLLTDATAQALPQVSDNRAASAQPSEEEILAWKIYTKRISVKAHGPIELGTILKVCAQ
jgi:hypothetical protein